MLFRGNFNLPQMRQGTNFAKVATVGRYASLYGIAVLVLASVCSGQAAIQLSRSIGPPTSKTLVSGQKFPPDDEVNLYFDRLKVGQTTTDSSGSFSSASIEVPKGALPGMHHVVANAIESPIEAKARFLVRTGWPQYGFRSNGGRHNYFENVLNPKTVGKLALRFSYAASSGLGPPVLAEGMVYVSSNDGNVYALNAHTGALIWKALGSGSAVADGMVYVMGPDLFLYALNAKTGAVVWAYNIEVPGWWAITEGTVFVTTAPAAGYDLFALDAQTGFLYWRTFIWSTPRLGASAVDGGVVYVGAASNDSTYDLLAVSFGSVLWQYPIAVSASPAVVAGVVYAGSADNNVYALDETTGSLLWKYSTTKPVYSSPAVADKMMYVGSEDGTIYALRANTGALVWKHSIGSSAASPAVANGVLYVASGDGNVYHLNALNAKTGALLWRYTLNLPPSDPVVANGMVYFGSEDGHLYAFGLPRSGARSTSTTPHPHPQSPASAESSAAMHRRASILKSR
jgi:outer membrane protein assembly factor BamB